MRFGLVGFAAGIAGNAASFAFASNMSTTTIAITFFLCPASLLCAPLFAWTFEAAEAGTPGFYVLWTIVALINAVLYALVGAAYVGLRRTPGGVPTA
jgi:hypothetical protein